MQTKKVVSMKYGSSASWDDWGLTWHFLCGIFTSIPTWTLSQNSLAAAEASSLKISSRGTSLKWSRPNDQENTHNYTKRGIPLWIWWKVNETWDNNINRIYQWRESHCRTTTSVRRKKEIQKSKTLRISLKYE